MVGFNDLPRSISTELSAQLSAIPSLTTTIEALDSGFPLIIRPLLDYDFSTNNKFKLNILFSVPSLTPNNNFCTVQSLTPLKYNISGVCFTGPLSREDVMLVTCQVVLCPKSLLLKATHTDWLAMAWTPRSRLTFQRNHKRATDCNGLKPLLHLGARYYLSTTFHTITLHTAAGTISRVSLTPLSILHVPCNSSFEDQEIGLGIFSSYFFSRIDFPTSLGDLQQTTLHFSYIIPRSQFCPLCRLTVKPYTTWIPFIHNSTANLLHSSGTFTTTSKS